MTQVQYDEVIGLLTTIKGIVEDNNIKVTDMQADVERLRDQLKETEKRVLTQLNEIQSSRP